MVKKERKNMVKFEPNKFEPMAGTGWYIFGSDPFFEPVILGFMRFCR